MKHFVLLGLVTLLVMSAAGVWAQESIAIGDSVEGQLTSGDRAEYRFDASEGDVLVISLISDDFDGYLYLMDADGNTLITDDDGGESTNALISGFNVPEDGAYAIEVASFDDEGSGAFTLSLDTLDAQTIEYGQVIEEEGGDPSGLYTFRGNTGDLLVAKLSAEGFDTSLELMGPDGYSVSYGSYLDGQTTRIGPITLTQDGTYQLNMRASGAFTLSLDNVEPVELTLGEPVTVSFTDTEQEFYFSLDNTRNQVVDIVVDSGNRLDTMFDLITPYGWSAGTAQDGERTVDPSLREQVLSDLGVHYLVVSPQNPNATLNGEITVDISAAELESLDDGPLTVEFDYLTGEKIMTFEGTAGEAVTLSVSIDTTEMYVSPTISLRQNDTDFSTVYMSGLKNISFEAVVPDTGEVTVMIQVYTEATVTVELSRDAE